MRGFHLIAAGLYLVALSAAGPLRKVEAYKHLARDEPAFDPVSIIPLSEGTDLSSSSISYSSVLTISTSASVSETTSASAEVPPPTQTPVLVGFHSTSYKNTTSTFKTASQANGNNALPLAAEGLTNSPITVTQTTASTPASSILSTSTIEPITVSSTQKTNSQSQTFSFGNTTSNRMSSKTIKTATLSAPLSIITSVVVLPHINPATPTALLNTSASILALPQISSATSSVSLSTTNAVPAPPKTSSAVSQSTLSNTSPARLPTETTTSTPIISQSTTTQSATPLPSAQYKANIIEAQGYNDFFATLNSSSPCTPGSAACLSGNTAACNQDGRFVISVCATGLECFAMPKNSTSGVVVECEDKEMASTVLGLNAVAQTSTSAVDTISTITTKIASPTSEPAATTTSFSAVSTEPFLVTITIVTPTLPTTTFATQSQAKPHSTTSIVPIPAAPQTTIAPESQTTSMLGGISIIPVSNQNLVAEKETVTVTVTKTTTIMIPEASAI